MSKENFNNFNLLFNTCITMYTYDSYCLSTNQIIRGLHLVFKIKKHDGHNFKTRMKVDDLVC